MKRILGALRRGKVAVLALMVALTLGGATTAMGHTGFVGLFHLNHSNAVNAISTLIGSVSGPVVRLDNNSANGTALNLLVEPNRPPMTVNSTAGKATNLNADQVDGKGAAELSRVAQGGGWARLPLNTDPVTAGTLSITAPADGFVRVNGNIQVATVFEDSVGGYVFPCKGLYGPCMLRAHVRHINSGTAPRVALEDVQNRVFASFPVNTVFPVSAGVNNFDVEVQREFGASSVNQGGDLELGSMLTAEYTPYGSTGTGTLGTGANVEGFDEFQKRLKEATPQQLKQREDGKGAKRVRTIVGAH